MATKAKTMASTHPMSVRTTPLEDLRHQYQLMKRVV